MSESLQCALVVEPDMRRAAQFRAGLQPKWSLTFATKVEQAIALARSHRFDAILVRFLQATGHGPQACETLRALPGGEDAVIVLYGRGRQEQYAALLGADKSAARSRWGFDEILRRTPSADVLDSLLQSALHRREARLRRSRTRAASPEAAPPEVAPPSRPAIAPKVRSARREGVDMAQELSWGEILQSDLSAESVQMLLRKRLGGRPHEEKPTRYEAPSGGEAPAARLIDGVRADDLPWRQLLSADVSRENIKRVMRKPIRLGGRREDRGEER